ncbi:MAG: multiheme c-type cytochrome [Candidatus Rifleibacteriota bacterium]
MLKRFDKLLILLVIAVSSLTTAVKAEGITDHQRLAQEAGCFSCHYMPPTAASATTQTDPQVDPRLKAGAGKWCISCHFMEERTLHPTGIAADPGAGLPLEEGSQMSCLTCHSPHRPAVASEPWAPLIVNHQVAGGYKTFLLNHRNDSGQLCSKCHADGGTIDRASMHRPRSFASRGYAGSESCKACHTDIFDQWRLTPHARMTRKLDKVEKHTEIPVEELGVAREKIAWVLGSHYVHRFVAEASGTLVVLPKIWDRHQKKWLPIHDHGWKNRYWLKQCAGCHTTGFSGEDDSFVEAGVGCESCHGPGLNHTRTGSKEFITSIKNLPEDRREMICESCHTSGLDNSGEYHFPAGYKPGDDLTAHFSGLTPKPGQSPENFKGDETYEDRRRQWDFLKSRFLLASGLTCDYCQNFRDVKTRDNSNYLSSDEYCLTCHTDQQNHPEESPGSNCMVCHQPPLNASGTMSIHDHKFIFKRPEP